jgi:hypothetical protein
VVSSCIGVAEGVTTTEWSYEAPAGATVEDGGIRVELPAQSITSLRVNVD